MSDEIKKLEERISNLEKKLSPNKTKLFGKVLNELGSKSSETTIVTSGQIKVKYGSKYVTIFKDGKLLVDQSSDLIKVQQSVGTKDGIYIVNDEIFIVAKGEQYELTAGATAYLSFKEELELTSEERDTALKNLGLVYLTLAEVPLEFDHGFVFIQEDSKFYFINYGNITELKSSELEDLQSSVDSLLLTVNNLKPSTLSSIPNKVKGNHFSLGETNGKSTLIVDLIIVKKEYIPRYSLYDLLFDVEYVSEDSTEESEESEESEKSKFLITSNNTYTSGDVLMIQTTELKDKYYILYKEDGSLADDIEVSEDAFDSDPINKKLILIDKDGVEHEYTYSEGIKVPDYETRTELVIVEFPLEVVGNNVVLSTTDLLSYIGYFIYPIKLKGQYITLNKVYGDCIELLTPSYLNGELTLTSTMQFNSSAGLPTKAIIMASGEVPLGWKLCDGTNGTPNLVNKLGVDINFIMKT